MLGALALAPAALADDDDGCGDDDDDGGVCEVFDYGDAPMSYDVNVANAAAHLITDPVEVFLGSVIPDDDGGAPAWAMPNDPPDGDDNGGGDDEDGVDTSSLTTFMDQGVFSAILDVTSVINTSSADAQLACWIDFDNNGTFDADERSQPNLLSNTLSAPPTLTNHYAIAQTNVGVTSPANALGAPDAANATIGDSDVLVADMGALVTIPSGENFTLRVRGELFTGNGTATIDTSPDNATWSSAGLLVLNSVFALTDFSFAAPADARYVRITRTSGAVLLDSVEYVETTPGAACTDTGITDGTFTTGNVPANCQGSATLLWSNLDIVPQSGTVYARCRVTTEDGSTAGAANFLSSPSPNGPARDGEVEDHGVDVAPTAATIGDVSLDAQSVEDMFNDWLADGADADTLRDLLIEWDPALDGQLDGVSVNTLISAARQYLDPDGDGLVATLRWETLAERGTAGFYVERKENKQWKRLNAEAMLPGLINAPMGGEYLWIDPDVVSGKRYKYRLIEEEVWGTLRRHGPWRLTMSATAGADSLTAAAADQQSKSNDDSENWDEWRVLGDGYAGHARRTAKQLRKARRKARRQARKEAKKQRLAQSATASLSLAAAASTTTGPQNARVRTLEEGLVQIHVADLAEAVGEKNRRLHRQLAKGRWLLQAGGVPQPYFYDKTTGLFSFAANFYRSRDTETNVYQLSPGDGETMRRRRGEGPPAGAPGVFQDSIFFDEHDPTLLLPFYVEDESANFIWWTFLYSPYDAERTVTVSLPDPAASGTGTLRLVLRGANDGTLYDDHLVQVSLNDQLLAGQVQWNGFDAAVLEVTFDASQLQADPSGIAETRITLHGQAVSPSPYSLVFLESVEVSYPRRMHARDGQLWVHNTSAGVVTVDGFDSADISVVEFHNRTRWREDLSIAPDGQGGWQVSFKARSGADYVVSSAPRASALETDAPSSLMDINHQADYLIIAPSSLTAGAEAMATYRGTTHTTEIAWLQDIYDEFGYGLSESAAIQAFLSYVYNNWQTVPSYVLLVGRATLDPADFLGFGENLLPTRVAATPWGLYGSDNRFADVTGDKIPDFLLGRLAVQNNAEVLDYVAKLTAYEAQTPGAAWMGQTVVVADNPDAAGDFHANSDETSSMLESYGYTAQKLYHPTDAVRADLVAGLGTGNFAYFNYDGHGARTQLGSENYLNIADVPGLSNGAQLPIFAALTCAVGDSTLPGSLGLADTLTNHPGGGAIAAFSPTGLSLDYYAHLMNLDLIAALIGANETLGAAARAARLEPSLLPFMLDIYHIQGDPAVRLPAP